MMERKNKKEGISALHLTKKYNFVENAICGNVECEMLKVNANELVKHAGWQG